ncbi:MAG: PAS domain S-box protein [Deltaproteobacteria bacterium]|nr:PAS domain S-box protein [Deltaproteobacteria bacterium]
MEKRKGIRRRIQQGVSYSSPARLSDRKISISLKELIDIPTLQELTDELYKATGIPSAIIAMDGEALTGSGWQEICTEFHRKNPQIANECMESDVRIRKRLDEGEPFALYRCPRGLTDASAPVVIEGQHVANVFAGQLFTEPPGKDEEEFFRKTAREYGFDERKYMAAFRKIPVLPEEAFRPALAFLSKFAQLLAGIGLARKNELAAVKALEISENKHRRMLESTNTVTWEVDITTGTFTYMGPQAERIFGYPLAYWRDMDAWARLIHDDDRERAVQYCSEQTEQGRDHEFEYRAITQDGGEIWIQDVVTVISGPKGPERLVGFMRDITETKHIAIARERAEEALRENRRFLAGLIENNGAPIFVKDANGRYELVNRKWEEVTGLKREQAIGKTDEELFPGPVGRQFRENDEKVLASGKVIEKEEVLEDSRGRRSFLSIKFPLRGEDGSVKGVCGITTEITARKQVEEKLAHAHNLMQYIISHARSAIAVHDKDLKYVYVSQEYLNEYKVKERDVIGKHHYEVFPDLPQKWRDVHQRALAGEVSSSEEDPYLRADGTVDWTRWECRPWYESDGSIGGFIIYTEVITDRKRREEELRENEERYRTLFERVGDYALLLEVDGDKIPIIADMNETALQMHGYSREEIQGKSISCIDPDISPEVHAERMRLVRSGKPALFTVRHQRKDGTLFDAEVSSQSVLIKGKKFVLSVERDITERKRGEKKRRELEERLHRLEKMEALGTLAGGVAHDLNNVLGAQLGYTELLLEIIPEGDPLRRYVKNIAASTDRAGAIIQDMLTMTRRGVSVMEVVNLNDVISGFLRSPVYERIRADNPGVTFSIDLSPEILNIKGSPVHLEKAVANLIINAAEAISQRGRVAVRTENRYLEKPIRGYDDIQVGDYVILTVSDTGTGISSVDIGKIFEPFYTKKAMGKSGTGLGLTIVWGMVKDHDGYIDVESEAGRGTTFHLYFPVTREEAAEARRRIPVEEYLGRGEKILVVDDVEEQRDVARNMLTRLGYTVDVCPGGEEAIEYLKTAPADLVVLDMIMEPGIDGFETYRRIREFKPNQKAIIVSGFSETERVQQMQALGAGAYVQKPYVMEKIGMAIRDELHR